jgi:hypothetical protein
MIYVKIICPCGQKYAFDAQPVEGRMPSAVHCPVCRADGTAAANEIIALKLGIMPPVKIICSCGQKYAFDVQPVDGRMPASVQCPVCRADGTAAANEIIALKLGLVPPSQTGVITNDSWRQRALEAERRAEQALAVLRENMTETLKETVIQQLAAQRSELLNAHEAAASEIAELIRRMDAAHAPLHERLHAYETRIQELEKELTARSEENRELLKLKVEMMKQQIETERAGNRLNFN